MADREDTENVIPATVEAVLAEFDTKKELLADLCEKTKNLIEDCLADAQIQYQSVQARVKNRKKLAEKYNDPEKGYKRLDDITDLAGVRIITYYEDEVDSVAEAIEREFEINVKNSTDRRNTEPDRFGYHAINYVCCHSAGRLKSVEYKRFSGFQLEIQITSILRHAWAEIEHDWYDLRDAYPPEIQRRFARMAALLEVAESEFLALRKKKFDYQRSVAVQIEANVSGVPLDAVSLRSFLEQDALAASIDQTVALARGANGTRAASDLAIERISMAANRAGLKTIEDLRNSLKHYEGAIAEFVKGCNPHLSKLSAESALPKGACVYYLGLMLIAKEGKTNLSRVAGDFGLNPADVEVLSSLAQTVNVS